MHGSKRLLQAFTAIYCKPNLIISKHSTTFTNNYFDKQKANYLYEIIRPKSKIMKTQINRILFSLKGKIAINR